VAWTSCPCWSRADSRSGHAAGNAIRQERRRQHRLPGGRERSARPGLCHGLGLEPRLLLGGALVRPVSHSPGIVLAPDPVRQARDRPVRPGPRIRTAHARAADGRRPRRHGCRGHAARRAVRSVRGRADVRHVRGDVPGAHLRPGHVRQLRQTDLGSRLSLGTDAAGTPEVLRCDPGGLGRCGRPSHPGADRPTTRDSGNGGPPTFAEAPAPVRRLRWRR